MAGFRLFLNYFVGVANSKGELISELYFIIPDISRIYAYYLREYTS